jgi:DNA-nicking Smr family endonuclease
MSSLSDDEQRKERVRLYNKKYREDNLELLRAKDRAKWAENSRTPEQRAQQKARSSRHYEANKDSHNESSRLYYAEHKEEALEGSRNRRASPEAKQLRNERHIERRTVDPEYAARCAKASTDWRVNNLESVRTSHRTRRATMQNVYAEKYSTHDVLDMYGTCCHLCGEEVDLLAPRRVGAEGWQLGLHIDHVIQIAHGGPDTLENVRPAHGLCNLRRPRS